MLQQIPTDAPLFRRDAYGPVEWNVNYLKLTMPTIWLKLEIAGIVEDALLLHRDGQRYRLLVWCVMPNHVHVLIETREDSPLSGVLHG